MSSSSSSWPSDSIYAIYAHLSCLYIWYIWEIRGKIIEFSQKVKNMRDYAGIAIICGSSRNMRENMRSHNRIFPGGLDETSHVRQWIYYDWTNHVLLDSNEVVNSLWRNKLWIHCHASESIMTWQDMSDIDKRQWIHYDWTIHVRHWRETMNPLWLN